ncbi:MAG: hypothetical protein VX154_05815 [Pseudomonadota bacterium]|nr:hypothetical protein [Pseudomonadota bacterium]
MKSKKVTGLTLSPETLEKLKKLCIERDTSPSRGKTFIVSELIDKAVFEKKGLYVKPYPSKDIAECLFNHYSNLIRIGSNLNQLQHLLQVKSLMLNMGELDHLEINVPFLLSLLKELNSEVQELAGEIKVVTKRYA